VNGGKVCREALTKVSFGNVGDSDAKAEDEGALCYYFPMTSIVGERTTHEHTIDSTYQARYSPMMLRYPRYTILSAKLLVVLLNESPDTLFPL